MPAHCSLWPKSLTVQAAAEKAHAGANTRAAFTARWDARPAPQQPDLLEAMQRGGAGGGGGGPGKPSPTKAKGSPKRRKKKAGGAGGKGGAPAAAASAASAADGAAASTKASASPKKAKKAKAKAKKRRRKRHIRNHDRLWFAMTANNPGAYALYQDAASGHVFFFF